MVHAQLYRRLATGLGVALALAISSTGDSQIIPMGDDGLSTLPGVPMTFLDIPTFGGGPIGLMGNPGSGGTDTVVRRLSSVDLTDGLPHTVPIELVALNLVSVNPITVAPLGSALWNVTVSLAPSPPSTASMVIERTTPTGGTWHIDSFFDVFVEIRLDEFGGPGNQTFNGHFQLAGGGNWHDDPATSFFDIFYEPFTLQGQGIIESPFGPISGFARHTPQSVPEPFTLTFGSLAALAGIRRIGQRKRRPTAA